jgi:hypothetical protein
MNIIGNSRRCEVSRLIDRGEAIEIPGNLMEDIKKYLDHGRCESITALVIEALETWIDREEDEYFWEVAQKHDEWNGESPHPTGTGFVPTSEDD